MRVILRHPWLMAAVTGVVAVAVVSAWNGYTSRDRNLMLIGWVTWTVVIGGLAAALAKKPTE